MSVNIVIVEDEALFRSLLANALRQCRGIELLGCYASGEEALRQAPLADTQVALIDIDLGCTQMDGIHFGLKLRELHPRLGIALLSNHPHLAFARALIASDFVGWAYLLKKSVQNMETVQRTIEGVSRGEVVFDPLLVSTELAWNAEAQPHLTPRQMELWQLITQGFSNVAIAKKLDLSTKWIDNAVGSLYRALDIDTHDPHVNARVAAAQAYARSTQNAHLSRDYKINRSAQRPAAREELS